MGCYRRLLDISYKGHFFPMSRFAERFKQLVENLLSQETETKVVWPCLKVFWFIEDNLTGQSERKYKNGLTEEVGRQY